MTSDNYLFSHHRILGHELFIARSEDGPKTWRLNKKLSELTSLETLLVLLYYETIFFVFEANFWPIVTATIYIIFLN